MSKSNNTNFIVQVYIIVKMWYNIIVLPRLLCNHKIYLKELMQMNGTRSAMPLAFNVTSRTRSLNTVIPFPIPQRRRILTFAERLEQDATILCNDAENYRDKAYVNAISKLYLVIAKATNVPAEKLKPFKISDVEVALAKLAKEHRQEYKELCKFWGVVPEEHRSKKTTTGVLPKEHLVRLTDWGYIELFFANMEEIIQLVAQKTYSSHPMSDMEKAKYAQIFIMFIVGHSMMYYDFENFQRVHETLEAREDKKEINESVLEEAVLTKTMEEEKKVRRNGSLLFEMYNHYMAGLKDGAINIDAIIYFLDMVEYDYKLQIREFMDMLTVYSEDYNEKSDFKSRHLSPIKNNFDIRLLKEKLFPCGLWFSDLDLFMTDIPDNKRKCYGYAYNRFKRYGYAFGAKVDKQEKPECFTHPASQTIFERHGYVYSRDPIEIQISDENELWLMRLV